MAELLVLTENLGDPKNPASWRRGHVIDVKPDGQDWGKCENNPRFTILKVPDMKLEVAQEYLRPKVEFVDIEKKEQVGIRDSFIDLDDKTVSLATQAKLEPATKAEFSTSEILPLVKKSPFIPKVNIGK